MTPSIIKKKVEQYFDIKDISTLNRAETYVLARLFYFKACYSRLYPTLSHKTIAGTIKRNHATSIHYQKKEMTKQESVLFSHFERERLDMSNVIQEQIKTKKMVIATNAQTLIKNHNRLKKDIEVLEKKKAYLKEMPDALLKKLSQLPEGQKQAVLERFDIILNMELKKVFTYREKRLKCEIENN